MSLESDTESNDMETIEAKPDLTNEGFNYCLFKLI